jgi:hypothetical protein
VEANKKFKDSLFSLIFSDEDKIRELYGAISGEPVPPDVPVKINTLEDALFMDRINDLSFTVGDRLVVLIEHQSTVNPNMALRLLIYMARVYEKIIDSDNLYGRKQLFIPRPEFYVLYNGVEEYPDEAEIRLSDSFRIKGEKTTLELALTVYNVNEGRNPEMLAKSEYLDGYSIFVEKVREYFAGKKGNEALDKAVRDAIEWCIRHGVLPEFFKLHGSEVRNMVFQEWNWDDCIRVREREAREDGYAEGVEYAAAKYQSQLSNAQAQLAERDAEIARLREQIKAR